MNCESIPFIKQPLRYNQIVFTTIKIIYHGYFIYCSFIKFFSNKDFQFYF